MAPDSRYCMICVSSSFVRMVSHGSATPAGCDRQRWALLSDQMNGGKLVTSASLVVTSALLLVTMFFSLSGALNTNAPTLTRLSQGNRSVDL